MFDINHQAGGYWFMIDIYSFTLYICFLCISGYVDSKKVPGGRGRARRSDAQQEPPCPPGEGVACRSGTSWSPPAHRGAGDARAALVRGWSPPAEKIVFVKHQPKLYLVDV